MSDSVHIETREITVVSKIVVGDKEYPLHKWNQERAEKYLVTKDKKWLEELKDFSLDFGL